MGPYSLLVMGLFPPRGNGIQVDTLPYISTGTKHAFRYNGLVPIAWKQDPESFLEYMFKVSLNVTCIVFYDYYDNL